MSAFRPFSNGEEHRTWLACNCAGCRSYRPNATTSRDGCPIEVAVALGAATDGTIPHRIAVRGGFLGPDGQGEPDPGVIPACPERRGRDEPDDRPRRGPRPPAGQLDLLDPRTAPDRDRVTS